MKTRKSFQFNFTTRFGNARTSVAFRILGILMCLVLANAAPLWGGRNYTVYVGGPSGGDDTATLQAALDNCMTNHPTGCTIQLSAGTYESQQLIAENFHGSFKGMGMDVTTIEVLAPLVVTISDENVSCHPPSRTNKYPVLLTFTGGDITVSDMTFKVSAYNPTTPWWYGGIGPGQTWVEGPVGVIRSSANLTVQRVGCEGGPGPIDGFTNYNNCVLFWGTTGPSPGTYTPLEGTFKFVSSRVRHSGNSWEVFAVRNARLVFGGSPSDGNVFEDSELGGAALDADQSVLEYSHNNVTLAPLYYAGLWVLQGVLVMPKQPSYFFLHDNKFEVTGGCQDGIFVGDFKQSSGQGKSADVSIFNNSISLASSDAGPSYAGVELYSTVGSLVINNSFSGAALYGIAVVSGNNCMLLVNDVADLTAENAPIWLDSGTSYCLVVGNGRPTLVLDQGTDDTLINVTKMQAADANTPMLDAPRPMHGRIPRLP